MTLRIPILGRPAVLQRSIAPMLVAFLLVPGEPVAAAPSTLTAPDSTLLGLWSARLDLGPAVRGEMRITRRGREGHATIADHEADFAFIGDSARFALADGGGEFRGSVGSG